VQNASTRTAEMHFNFGIIIFWGAIVMAVNTMYFDCAMMPNVCKNMCYGK